MTVGIPDATRSGLRGKEGTMLDRRLLIALLLAAVCGVSFLALADEAHEQEVFAADYAVQHTVQAWRQPMLERPVRMVSDLGSGRTLVPLCVAVVVLLWWRGYRGALLVPLLASGSVVIEGCAKWLVGRHRPHGDAYGFPSGHVLGIVIVFGLLLYIVWHVTGRGRLRWVASGTSAVIVVAVAFSRIYLNAHWLSDVVGAGVAGLTFVCGAIAALGDRLTVRTSAGSA